MFFAEKVPVCLGVTEQVQLLALLLTPIRHRLGQYEDNGREGADCS